MEVAATLDTDRLNTVLEKMEELLESM